MDDHADGEPKEGVDRRHPLGVAPGQVVVHRHHMDAPPGEGVQIHGQRGHQRLSLSRLHLGDPAFVQDDAADELYVEMAHPEGTLRRLAHHGKGLGQKIVKVLALFEPSLELVRLGAQVRIGQGLDGCFLRVDAVHDQADALDLTLVPGAEYFFKQKSDHCILSPSASAKRTAIVSLDNNGV